MNPWPAISFVRLLIPFLAGILLYLFNEGTVLFWVISFLFLLGMAGVWVPTFKTDFRRNIFGISAFLLLMSFGYFISLLHSGKQSSFQIGNWVNQETYKIVYTISAPPVKSKSGYKVFLEAAYVVLPENKHRATEGKVLAYLPPGSASQKLRYGDMIIVKSRMFDINPPANPNEFNYKSYLANKGITYQCFIREGEWTYTGRFGGNILKSYAERLQERFLHIMQQNHISGDAYGVAAAMILGYNHELTPEIISSYASTGALHVLSVSGLHVGIIFLVISFLFRPTQKWKWFRIPRILLILSLVWLYAFLTGLSPSVCRSAVMFTIIMTGQALNRKSPVINTVALSAFILLCFNPFYITDVGFQLSYLAVAGIVLIHPRIYQLYRPESLFMKPVWGIISVSIAAQLATFPLGIFYFHQFPNYFLLSNLLVIPLSTLVLYGGIILLVVEPLSLVASLTGRLVGSLTEWLNKLVAVIDGLPYAVSDGLNLSVFETLLMYILILSVALFLIHKHALYLKISIAIMCILVTNITLTFFIQSSARHFTVYHIRGHHAAELVQGHDISFWADSALRNDRRAMQFHIIPNWIQQGVYKKGLAVLNEHPKTRTDHVIEGPSGSTIYISDAPDYYPLSRHPGIIVLNPKHVEKNRTLMAKFPSATFVFDGRLPLYAFKKIKQNYPQLTLLSTAEKGSITFPL